MSADSQVMPPAAMGPNSLHQAIDELKRSIVATNAQKELLANLLAVAQSPEAIDATLQKTLEISARLTHAERGSIFLLNETNEIYKAILIRGGVSAVEQQQLVRGVMESGLAGWVAQNHKVGLVADTMSDERWVTLPDQPYDVRSALAVPINRDDRMLGLLTLIHSQPAHFSAEDAQLMQATASQIALVLENAQLYVDLQQELMRRKQAEIALQKANDELEQRVQERTAELAQANFRLQSLSKQLLTAQEDERRRIARELHDQIGQSLTAVKIDLQGLQRHPEAASLITRLDDSAALVEQAIQQVRTMSLDLRPSLLDDLGLEIALRWYLNRQAERAAWATEVTSQLKVERLPIEIETVCFRIAQEAITNTMRHAQAKRVQIELHQEGNEVEMIIRDDGKGFEVNEAKQGAARGASMGVLGMQERATLAGGQMDIVSAPDQGATLRLRFTLEAASPLAEAKK